MLSWTRSGFCEYFEKEEYYQVAAVFGLRRVELYVGTYMLQGSKNVRVESGGAKFDCTDTQSQSSKALVKFTYARSEREEMLHMNLPVLGLRVPRYSWFARSLIENYESVADSVLVGAMNLSMWNITDCEGCRIQFGHDPRYSPYERLFFGQVVFVSATCPSKDQSSCALAA